MEDQNSYMFAIVKGLPTLHSCGDKVGNRELLGCFLTLFGGVGKDIQGFVNNRNTLTAVAIKRSNPESRQGINEFQTEITILSKLLHCHLVSLIGCCMEANESILVYSFMARGALADHLYKTKESPLPWKKRRCSSTIALSPHVVREAMYHSP